MEHDDDPFEQDMYIAQLQEVFDSCDQTGSHKLNREELFLLCDKLQLEDQSVYLVDGLLADKLEVDFDEFKESFVSILCQTVAKVPTTEEESESDDVEESGEEDVFVTEETETADTAANTESTERQEMSPKYMIGTKRYGRRSMPLNSEEFEFPADDEDDIEVRSSTQTLKHSLASTEGTDTEEDGTDGHKKRRRHGGQDSSLDGDGTETYEAEGQLNQQMPENPTSEEEEYLRGIWTSLRVGQNGYIEIDELSRVCTHIGMDEMDDIQLQQLFDKLDADGDGKVSFHEFLHELFQHSAPAPQAPQPRAVSAQKKVKFPGGAGSEDRITPSLVPGTGVSGLFSVIDPERTGFAKPDPIIDLWEKSGIKNGADILLALGFDLKSKVNLSELSACLEHELVDADEQNLMFQAATASYQQEMRHLKSSLEQAAWAKEKLKLDLAESNARSNLLAKEVDEQHASMEKSSESKLLSVEKKYQEQVKVLQGELDKERESFTAYAAKHKQVLEAEMGELKHDEAKLREQLSQTQKEMEKLGHDLEDMTGQLEESERVNQRLQRELGNVDDIHRKLAEYENKELLNPNEQRFTQEKLQRLEQESKDMKDRNDELTAELETMKQQVGPGRKLGRDSPDADTAHGMPGGRKVPTPMSYYVKPTVGKKSIFSSTEFSDEDERSLSGQGRRLPYSPLDEDTITSVYPYHAKHNKSCLCDQCGPKSNGKTLLKSAHRPRQLPGVGNTADKEKIEELKKDLQELKDHFEVERREIEQACKLELKDHLEIERREIEQACKLEIAAIEEKHDAKKTDVLKHIEAEKTRLAAEFDHLQQQALAELAQELQTKFVHEKEDIIEKYETEKNHLIQKHAEELKSLTTRLECEFEQETEDKIQHLKNRYDQERYQLEEALAETEPFIKDLENRNSKLEVKLKKQTEESEKQLQAQKSEMEAMLSRRVKNLENVEKEKHEFVIQKLEMKLKKQTEDSEKELQTQKSEMEGMLTRHMKNLESVEKEKHELEITLRKEMNSEQVAFQKEKLELETTLRKEMSNQQVAFQKEKLELNTVMDKQAQDIRDLQKLRAELELSMKQQKGELELSFRQEKQEIKQLYEEKVNELEIKLAEAEKQATASLDGGVEGLKGKTREDFFRLVESRQEEHLQNERQAMTEMMDNLQKQLETEFDTRNSELSHVFDREKTELSEKYESEIEALRHEMHVLQEKLEEEREALARRYDEEKVDLEDQVAQQLRDELEDEFCQQMEEIKEAYDDEKQEYESQVQLLQGEMGELQAELEKVEQSKRRLDEVNKVNKKLQLEKRQAEKGQAEMAKALKSTKEALEARIDELISEKEGAVTAVKAELVQSSQQSEHEKASLDAVVKEKQVLEEKVSILSNEVLHLKDQLDTSQALKDQVERLEAEKNDLMSQLHNQDSDGGHLPAQAAQRAINELTHEKSELEEQLFDTQTKLAEIEDMAKKYTHLQFDLGQLTIGQSALEESLIDTQDRLADTQACLMQAERELKEANRYRDKYKLLQRKYEDVCKERDKTSHFAKSLKEQLNKANTASKEDHEDKGRLTVVLDEKKALELQLQRVSDKLLEATTNFAVSQSQHIRELQQWKEQCGNMVDLQRYTRLQIDLVDNQRSLRDLQEALNVREESTGKLFKESSVKHAEEVKSLEELKQSLETKLKALQQILDGQLDKFKEQYEAGERRNALVVDLYKENAELMDSLYKVEVQKKDAVSRCYKLEDQCNQLRRLLKRVAKVAIT